MSVPSSGRLLPFPATDGAHHRASPWRCSERQEEQPEAFLVLNVPYHRVKDGIRYPAVLFLTGANDARVDPMHSRKMTARLQAGTGPTGTVLLRTSASSGHGFGTSLSEAIEQEVDVYAFLFHQLGVEYWPVSPDGGASRSLR